MVKPVEVAASVDDTNGMIIKSKARYDCRQFEKALYKLSIWEQTILNLPSHLSPHFSGAIHQISRIIQS